MQVNHLSLDGIFHDISFEVAKGEILGLYGLVGAGRSEIVETIFGARKATSGSIRINDKLVTINSTVDAVRAGIALVPENRKTQGLILEASCKENLNLTVLDSLKKGGVVDEACAETNYQTYQKKSVHQFTGKLAALRQSERRKPAENRNCQVAAQGTAGVDLRRADKGN